MRFFLIFAAFLSSALGSGIPPSATDIATGNNVASDAAAANCTGPLNCPGMVMIFDKDGYKGNLQYMISMYNLNHYFKDNADCYAIRQNFLSSVFLKTRLGRKHWGCWMYS
ncbi:hypothetical protein K458DRAFT_396303 [Lentithecium fluviatile CBS 122367]|uniref:Killer toxin Kp4 domain-containing protein n=1 Tax=Lentithecium fluviatile CBS 122367 TaxID=1168545 RepID=A0A6G1IFQ7_9PLEO|nr:hypothetical protein K458DRAFT_396303 [Lentithecium fluviatile CBS 122367]